jgi:peptide/nickel transport system permease protein
MSELQADKLVDGALAWRAPPAPPLPPLSRRIATTISNAFYELRKSRTASIGAVMLVLLFGACIATPWIATHDPIKQNYRERLQPPSEKHWLGTDRLGRDIYSRLLYGGRRLVTIAVVAVTLSLLVGVPFGVLTGYFGGLADTIGMRIVDGLLAFPGLLLYLLFVTVAQAWKFEGFMLDAVLVGALALAGTPEKARLARGSVLAEKQKEYVEASRAVGESSARIALSQILPNIISPLIVTATVRLGFVILIVAALSFLGLGTPPPTPDWGSDLSAARDYMETHPLIAAFPGLAICYTVLAFNLFGDGLRDILDPRLAER